MTVGTLNNDTYKHCYSNKSTKHILVESEVGSLIFFTGFHNDTDFRSPTSGCGVHFWHHASGTSSSGNGKQVLGSSYNMYICLVGSQ